MKLNLKLRPGTSKSDVTRLIGKARAQGVERAEALFPDSPVQDLRSMFVLEAPESADSDGLMKMLSSEDCVQFVEQEPRRKLVR